MTADMAVTLGETAVKPVDIAVTLEDTAVTSVDIAVTLGETAVKPVDIAVTLGDTAVTPVDISVTLGDTVVTPVDAAVTLVDMAVTLEDTVITLVNAMLVILADGAVTLTDGTANQFHWDLSTWLKLLTGFFVSSNFLLNLVTSNVKSLHIFFYRINNKQKDYIYIYIYIYIYTVKLTQTNFDCIKHITPTSSFSSLLLYSSTVCPT